MRYDVVVAGGGPGGSSAAFHLAREGVKVLVLEKSAYPRAKVCGEGLSPRAVRSLYRMGLKDGLEGKYNRVTGLGIYGSNSKGVECPFPPTPRFPDHGYVVPRKDLDEMLADLARQAGADILTEHRAIGPILEDGRVAGVKAIHGDKTMEFEADVVIGADGGRSTLGESLGLLVQDQCYLGIAIRQYFEGVEGVSDLLEVYPEGVILPCCGWMFPLGNGLANVGVGAMLYHISRRKMKLKDVFSTFVTETKHASRKLKGARPVGPLEAGLLRIGLGGSKIECPGLMLIGDAASLANPVSGEGIPYALESGEMAAETILENRALAGEIFHDPLKNSFRRKLHERYNHYFGYGIRSIKWGTRDSFMVPLIFTIGHHQGFRDWLARALFYMRH